MPRSLVIVESPAKAKTINKYLGRSFIVKSSYGHIRDLPTGGDREDSGEPRPGKKKPKPLPKSGAARIAAAKAERARVNLIRRMGVDPDRGWAAHYEILPGKEKVLRELREYAKDAPAIYLATDLDREGEAIAWHLREAIGGDPRRFKRVVFQEITKAAISQAFEKPGELNLDRVNAQQARRFLDRVVGFMLSPLLWAKVARGLSAGRVQSVATRLVVEREREIHQFNPEEYWELHADLQASGPIRVEAVRYQGEAFKPVTKAQCDEALGRLGAATFRVTALEDRPSRQFPAAPLITSTLQQAASTRLGYSLKKTMVLAQRLYEAGLITYMRTDSTNLSAEAVAACRTMLDRTLGAVYVPEKPPVYSSKKGAQEAHEAIRPTDLKVVAADLSDLESDQVRLYDLIWRRFVASQMSPAEYDTVVVTVGAADYEFRASGRVVRFDGWLKVLPPAKKDEVILPKVAVGDVLVLVKLDPSQHFTKPPPRFSEAGLVKELEKRGIGRPSTYASIISTIQDRGYVKLVNRRFHAEKLGDLVTDRLVENFSKLLDYGFTASMEDELDGVATAKEEWKTVLDRFYADFKTKLDSAGKKMRGNAPVETEIKCPKCGRTMAVRTGRTGVFLGCTGYALPPKERCTGTLNLVPGQEAVGVEPPGEEEEEQGDASVDVAVLRAMKRCPVCTTAMDSYLVDEQRKLHVCHNSPDCPGTLIEHGTFKLKGYEGPVIACDKCGADMQLRVGRFGKYFGCTKYPECKNTRKLLRSGEAAPPKSPPVPMPELHCSKSDAYFVLRDGALGIFLAAHNFPRSRETKPPQVADLKRHRSELDPKFHYLADAPEQDPDGNPAIIRFSRKTREHFLSSMNGQDWSPWSSYFVNGKWVSRTPEKEPPKTDRKGKGRGKGLRSG